MTTLEKRHVEVRGGRVSFSFRGKHGLPVRTTLLDPSLAAALRGLLELPGGRRVFTYTTDGGKFRPLTAPMLNDYLRIHLGEEFSAKDFRTWGGTLTAAIALAARGPCDGETETKRAIAAAMRLVGDRLGNTPAVARASYVSPSVIEQYRDGRTLQHFQPQQLRVVGATDPLLAPEERALLALLRSWRIRSTRAAAA